ncbi:MAG: hypothetical protein ACK56I_04955, partial [bacterium]
AEGPHCNFKAGALAKAQGSGEGGESREVPDRLAGMEGMYGQILPTRRALPQHTLTRRQQGREAPHRLKGEIVVV